MKLNVLGVLVDYKFSFADILRIIKEHVKQNKKLFITTVNPEMIIRAQEDQEFKDILNRAGLSLPDGSGLRYAAFWQFKKIKQKIAGSDLTKKIIELAEKNDFSVYLLGGDPHSAEMAKIKLEKKFPKVRIVGAKEGMTKEEFSYNNQKIIDSINRAAPDILFVAFGVPKQEKWISRNIDKLPSVKVAAGIGGTFEFLAGMINRAPLVFRALDIEWLWRLGRQPQRFKRIYNAVIKFPIMVVFSRKTRNR